MAPLEYNGKKLVYEEVFRSPGPQPTAKDATEVLEKIRASHSEKYGWVEFEAKVEYYGGGWHAVRYHAQYK